MIDMSFSDTNEIIYSVKSGIAAFVNKIPWLLIPKGRKSYEFN